MGCTPTKTGVVDIVTPQSRGVMLATPKFHGDESKPLFNGLLYRIIHHGTGTWAFFNNSRDYEFHISYLFGLDSKITPLSDTSLSEQDDGILCTAVVYPLETKMFVQGEIDVFESKLEAMPLSEEYFGKHPELNEAEYLRRLEPQSKDNF